MACCFLFLLIWLPVSTIPLQKSFFKRFFGSIMTWKEYARSCVFLLLKEIWSADCFSFPTWAVWDVCVHPQQLLPVCVFFFIVTWRKREIINRKPQMQSRFTWNYFPHIFNIVVLEHGERSGPSAEMISRSLCMRRRITFTVSSLVSKLICSVEHVQQIAPQRWFCSTAQTLRIKAQRHVDSHLAPLCPKHGWVLLDVRKWKNPQWKKFSMQQN